MGDKETRRQDTAAITAALPHDENGVQRCWNQLFREFAADVRGEGSAGYPTFHDGWVATEVIDAALTQRPWAAAQKHERTA